MVRRIAEILKSAHVGDEVSIEGWVRTRRDSKDFSFLEVNDGSCLANLQIVADGSLPAFEENVLNATTGSSVHVDGQIVESPGKGQRVELKAQRVTLVGTCPADNYPLQKKRHSFEFLRSIQHLRPRTNTIGAVARVRHTAAFAIHSFFDERGFFYLHSPIISSSDCEGAGELFRVTTLDLQKAPRREGTDAIDYSQDFFGAETFLTVSGQLEAEIYANALGKVYTFGPTFRAENSNTPRHLAEFWMVEPEVAFCDLAGDMALAEDFIKYVLRVILDRCGDDISFFNQWVEKGVQDTLESVASASFEHLTYDNAIDALTKANVKFEYPVSWGMDLQTEHERYLTETFVGKPVFVTNYPRSLKPFYMRVDEDGRTVSAMDLLVPRVGEIIGGSQREEREDVLRQRIRECGMSEDAYQWYIELRTFGTTPHAGFGLGFDRLVMYATGMQNVRDIIPFPRTPGSAGF